MPAKTILREECGRDFWGSEGGVRVCLLERYVFVP